MAQNNTSTIERRAKARRITSVANGIGGAFLVGFGAIRVINFILGMTLPEELIINEGFIWILQIVLSVLMFVPCFIIFTKPMNTRVSAAIDFSLPKKGTGLPMIFFAVGMSLAANVLGGMFTDVLEFIGLRDTETVLSSDPTTGVLLPIISVLASAALPALIEEFAIHGIVLGAMRPFGDRFAIVISSLMFGLMHGTVEQIPFAFVGSLAACFAIIRSGSIWVGVAAHFINNFIACIIDIATAGVSEEVGAVVGSLLFVLALFLSLFGLYLSRERDLFSLPDEKMPELSSGLKFGAYLRAPCIIIMIIWIILEMVENTIFAGMM